MTWRRDVVYGILAAIFGLFMIYETSQIPLLGDVRPIAGARYYLYPWFLLLFLSSLCLIFQGISKKKQTLKENSINGSSSDVRNRDWFVPLPTLFTLGVLILYLILIPLLGYEISTFLFLLTLFNGYFLFCQKEGLSFVIQKKKAFIIVATKYAIASIVVVALIQLIFGFVLDVRLPG